MDKLLKTENDVWWYLYEKRTEILYKVDEAMSLNNRTGAKAMMEVCDTITDHMGTLKFDE